MKAEPVLPAKATIKFVALEDGVQAPQKKTEGAGAFDLCNYYEELLVEEPRPIRTGLSVEIPEGYSLLILPRSGLSLRDPTARPARPAVQIANSPGLIDSDYRGEIQLIVRTLRGSWNIPAGTRLAQALLIPNIPTVWEQVEELSDTDRGTGGLGSTGL